MSKPSEFERTPDGFEADLATPMLLPSAERLRNAKSRQRFPLFQELLDLVPFVFRDHALRQQLGDYRPSFALVPIRSSRLRLGFAHCFGTIESSECLENKLNFTGQKQYNRDPQNCETKRHPLSAGLEKTERDAAPLTVGEFSPDNQTSRREKISSTTRNRCLFTDGGTTAKEILDNNGVGQTEGYNRGKYGGSKRAHDALDEFIEEYVDDERIISSRSIANALDTDVRAQELGKTLGAHLEGNTPDGWFEDVEVSMWRDTSPKKWRFVRVAGRDGSRNPTSSARSATPPAPRARATGRRPATGRAGRRRG